MYATDIAFPFRFTEDCDLQQDIDSQLINQSVMIIGMTPTGTVPLDRYLGNEAANLVFDPLDDETMLAVDTSLRNAFARNESRIYLDKEFTFDEDTSGSKVIVTIPYRIVITNELMTTRLPLRKAVGG